MRKKRFTKGMFLLVVLILVLVMLYSGLRILESTVFYNQQEQEAESKSIIRDGVRYFPRQDITVVMVLGIERTGLVEQSEATHDYPADMITLMIFDEQTEQLRLLTINRDTMTMMDSLNEYGRADGRYYTQLALSFALGSGGTDSCDNTRNAVSELLYGLDIDHYFAMNMDAIALFNDAVGGVTVTVTEDFSAIDDTIPVGTVTLNGQQALNFVQARQYVGEQLNTSRMARQSEYMKGFVQALGTKLEEGVSAMLKIYEQVSGYAVTDCSTTVMNRLLEDYGDYTLTDVQTLPGESVLGEQYYEFYVDEEQLDALILELFYAPVE